MMSKDEYLLELKNRLHGLNDSDIDDALSYCEEYFDEAGEGNEQQVIDDIGEPAKFAAQMRADAAIRSQSRRYTNQNANTYQGNAPRGNTLRNIGMVTLGIFAMPIALPLALAAVMLIFALIITLFALAFAMALCFGVFFIAGVLLIINGIVNIGSVGNAMIAMGSGLICMGIGSLVLMGFYKVIKSVVPAFMRAISRLYERAKEGRKR